MNDTCIFCKIVTGAIPSNKEYEDELFLGFLDIQPVEKGHTLLIPKNHYEWMVDAPDEIVAQIFVTAKNLIQEMKEKFSCDYVEIKVIGKDVPHFHIHLIPRKL